MAPDLKRRDFLRLMALLPLAKVCWQRPSLGTIRTVVRDDRPNVLILVFDALSARNTSLYGYRRETTPNLARFAERATVYHRHYAGGNHTSPGVASLLTGTYPWSHRAFHLHGSVDESYGDRNLFSELSRAGYYTFGYSHNLLVTSLMHQFRQDIDLLKKTRELCLIDDQFSDQLFFEDYNVAFWSEWMLLREGESPPGSLLLSLFDRARRFLHRRQLESAYRDLFPRGIPNLHSLFYILEHAIDWLKDELSEAPAPFFGYVHLLPPHEPYYTRREFVDCFDDGWSPVPKEPGDFSQGHSNADLNRQRREYDEYLAYADAEFGRLYDSLARTGILEDTWIVVTSDHGELFERGIRGHVTPVLYEPVIQVPLLISRPGQDVRQDVQTVTSAVDLLPTIIHVAGRSAPRWCEGQILPPFRNARKSDDHAVYSVEAKGNPKQAVLRKATVTLIKDQYKLIHYSGYGAGEDAYELYDLAGDPEEEDDLYAEGGSRAGDLRAELEEKLETVNASWQR